MWLTLERILPGRSIPYCQEYGISSKVFYCLSDNGSNMKKGIRLLSEESDMLETDLDEVFWDVWDDIS